MTPREKLLAQLAARRKESAVAVVKTEEVKANENTQTQVEIEKNVSLVKVQVPVLESKSTEVSTVASSSVKEAVDPNSAEVGTIIHQTIFEEETKEIDPRFQEIKMMMAQLEQELEGQVPGFAMTLKRIHEHLKNDAESVTILTDEEIGTIVQGLEKHSGITITASKSGKGSKAGKTQPVTADML